ncbi:hypothetical protein RND71_017103 [Anisodus tanguticus]|uniref:Uncharacterized protein n=1 Tax=Anisodus tanguticus TaxID=243964 RepID=A0AAE1S355_9SOLA|nr:hypothetical protein RND71_017103 [Anisodus tanguticus]
MDMGTTPLLSSPKPSTVPNRSLSGSRETNENEQPHDQKPMTKNFMSPTISASSKASVPIRKKTLAERNEISSSCESLPPHKASNLGSKTKSLNSTSHRSGKLPISSYSYALRNCNDNQGSLQQAEDSSNLPEKDNLVLENDEDVVDGVEDDEEIEEEVVDRGMESERAFQDSASIGSGDMIRKNIFEAVFHEIYGSGSVYVDQPEYSENGFLELMSQRETNDELKAVEFVEDTVGLLEVESAEMEKVTEPQEGLSADIDIVDLDSTEFEVTQECCTCCRRILIWRIRYHFLMTFQVLVLLIQATNLSKQKLTTRLSRSKKSLRERAGEEKISETLSKGAEEIDTEFETSNLEIDIESENAEVKEFGPSNAVIIIGVSAASVLLVASLVIIYVTRKPKASIEIPQTGVEGEPLERKTDTFVENVSSLLEPLNDPSENLRSSP